MTTERERFEPWLQSYLRPRYPELEEPILRAIDAFDAIQETGQITPERLSPITDAITSRRQTLSVEASRILSLLTSKFPEVCDVIVSLSQHAQSHVRFNSLLCLSEAMPPQSTLQILRQGLRDKSAKVRWKAASLILGFRLRECLSDLEAAAAKEKVAQTKEWIERDFYLLRDGYSLGSVRDERIWICVLRDREAVEIGVTGTLIRCQSIEVAELNRRGIDQIVAEFVAAR